MNMLVLGVLMPGQYILVVVESHTFQIFFPDFFPLLVSQFFAWGQSNTGVMNRAGHFGLQRPNSAKFRRQGAGSLPDHIGIQKNAFAFA